jgi:serine/threonine protein kinase
MHEPGEVIASGRDTEIVAWGPGRVWRRPRQPRSLADEAAVMRWVRDQGYPCPEVVEVVDNGLVMERIDGPSLLEDLGRHPWRMRQHATLLADLQAWLHRLAVPDPSQIPLHQPYGPGPSLIHLDFHPENVMLTDDGPVVIDWSNTASGPPGADLAVSWLLMGAGDPGGSPIDRVVVAAGRGIFLRCFLAGSDRPAAQPHLRSALEHRRADPHLSSAELDAMARIVQKNAI